LYYTSNVTLDNYFYSYEIGDYNGDLILDAMLIKTIYNIKIADGIPKKQMISINKVPFIGNGGEDFINDLYYGFYFASSNNSLGSEILLVTKNNLTVVEARTNFFTYRTYALSGQFNPPTGYTFDQLQLQVSDFNGDGISDLLCIKTTTPTSQSNINYFDRFMYDQMGVIYSHVYKSGAEKITNVWVALGNGQSFNSWKSLTLPSYANYIQTPNLTFNIGDFIGDSKVEILFTEQISSNKNLINSHFYEITEEGFIQKLQLSHYLNDNSCSNLINFTSDKIDVADFNSDGKLELFVKNYSTCSNKIINFTKDNCFSDLVSSIENGYGNINQFTYNYLNNSNNYSIVNTTITSAVSVNEPIKIVTNYKFLTPTKTVTNNNYYYKNLLYKNTGGIRGILGFEEMTISELISNRKKITNFTFPDDQLNSLFPAKITTYNLNNIKISESTNSNTFFTNGYFKILSSTSNLDKDYLKSTSIKKVSNFETTFGNLISSENWIYDDINLSQLTYYRKQDFLDYVQSGSWCQNKFQTLKSTYLNPNSGKPATVFTDKITYNNGNLNSYKKFSGTDNEITTTYSNFNAFGTPKTIAISALNVDTKINTNEYDYTGRFVLRTTNSLGQQNSFSYDNFGNLISETNLNSITTNYTYNGFNQLTKIITNEGEIEQDIEWTDGSYPNSLYRKAIYRDDRQAEFTYYDYLGQEISFQTTELKNIYQDKIYNDDGTINSISNLYYESELPQLNKIEYDEFNRVLKTESKGNIINFSYVGNKVTLTDSKSRNKSTTTNAVGKVTQTKDIQGNVISNYTYDNLLQPLTIGTNTISYNSYGLKESITDPNSGTISYGYDAYGRLTSQIDAAGIKYEYTYDVLDRILSSKTTNDEIIYSYVTKGYGIGNIESTISLSNGNAKYFYYNRLGKIEILKEISAGQTFITKYEYDETGNNISVIYPSGLKITNNYSSGTLISVSKDNKVIWRINEKNSTSLKYNFGDNKTTTVSYTFDEISRQLKEIKAQTLSGVKSFHYTYNFDVNTGNLINRKDNLNLSNNKPLFEEFDYNLDRLSQIKQNGTITNTINYATNGNILQKSDVGTYTYDQSKVNLVTRITPPPTEFALTQNITYNKFGKATKITEGVNTFNIMYGPNQERVKMEYLNSSDNSKNFTRYYACNFEKEIKGSTTKEINYIASSNGTIAAYITVNGSNGQFYYFIHDHLGSIVQIIDNNGVVVEERSFDAWGRKRNVKDWTYTVTNTPSLISRGYTGHEHLYEVGIINTNARLYEPLTGRMLSPDIYIQTPDNLQSYNRYSYVMNNPLKYNDPSGNIWGLVIGAIVGMELGGTIANNGEPNPFKWKNNSATWIGVIGGGIAGALIGDGIEALAGGNPVIFRGTGATQVKPGEQGAGGFNNMPIGTKNTLGQQIENTTISPNSINSTLGYTNEIPGNGTQLELWKSYWRSGLDNLTYATDNQFVNVVMQYLVRSMSQPTTMATMNNLNNGNINNYTDRNIGGSFMPVGGGSIFDFTINVTGNNFTNVDINHSSVAGNTYSLGFSANGNTLQTTVLSFNFNSTQEARRFSTHFDNIMINQRNLLMNNGLPFSYYKTYFP
jgi:RHS repeat-associated protein